MASSSGFDPDRLESINDINITPFVDVVLVLLVIFMVAAPVMVKQAIDVKLPSAKSGTAKTTSTTFGISVLADGQILFEGQVVTEEELRQKALMALSDPTHQVQAIIAADLKAEHGFVVKVIDIIKGAGIEDFAFQVERPKS